MDGAGPNRDIEGANKRGYSRHQIALLGDTQWGEYSPENITVVFLIFKLECFVSFLIVQHWSSLLK